MSNEQSFEYKHVDSDGDLSAADLEKEIAWGWQPIGSYSILSDDGQRLERHLFRRLKQDLDQKAGSNVPDVPTSPEEARSYGEQMGFEGGDLEDVVCQVNIWISNLFTQRPQVPERYQLMYESVNGFYGVRFRNRGAF